MKSIKKLLIFVLIILGIVIMDKYTFTNTWKNTIVEATRDYDNGQWIKPPDRGRSKSNTWVVSFDLGERPLGNSKREFFNDWLLNAFAGYLGNGQFDLNKFKTSWARENLIANGVTMEQFKKQFIYGPPRSTPYSYFMAEAVATFHDLQEYIYTRYFNRNSKPGDWHTDATIRMVFYYTPYIKNYIQLINIRRNHGLDSQVSNLYPATVDTNIYDKALGNNKLQFFIEIIVGYEHWIINEVGELELEYTDTKEEEYIEVKEYHG